MKKKDRHTGGKLALNRRGFAVAGLAGMGLIMARASGQRPTANVSMKEAAHYVALDPEREEK